MESQDIAIEIITKRIKQLDELEMIAPFDKLQEISRVKTELYQCLVDIRRKQITALPPLPASKPDSSKFWESDGAFGLVCFIAAAVVLFFLFHFKILVPEK